MTKQRKPITRCPDLPQFLLSQKAQGQGPVLAETELTLVDQLKVKGLESDD